MKPVRVTMLIKELIMRSNAMNLSINGEEIFPGKRFKLKWFFIRMTKINGSRNERFGYISLPRSEILSVSALAFVGGIHFGKIPYSFL
jgi:hypothetical protein